MFYLVYKITNIKNGKFYIGCHKTEDMNDGYFGSGKILKLAIKKHGIENFTKEIIHEANSSKEMFQKEKELVKLGKHSYNLKEGGSGGFDYINKNLTKEDRSRIGKIANTVLQNLRKNDIVFQAQFNEKLRIAALKRHKEGSLKSWKDNYSWLGKTHTEETKQKMATSHQGKHIGEKNSQYGKMWINNGTISTRINKTDDVPFGWKKGRINGTIKYTT